jgi:hypothetical protein
VQIVQHRARGVAVFRRVQSAAGEIPQQPAVHGAERQLTAFGAGARTRDVVQQPAELAAGEVGVDDEAGASLDLLLMARLLEAVAEGGGAAVLPDNRVMHRSAGLAVPQERRLALIGNTDGGDVARRQFGCGQCLPRRGELRFPDLDGIVLHPSGLRKDLRELLLRDGANRSVVIEDDGARTGGPLVEGEDGTLGSHGRSVLAPRDQRVKMSAR